MRPHADWVGLSWRTEELCFNEIGEMPAAVQVKLLRVLQEPEFERVGGNESVKTDIRILAATNQSLQDLVAKGKFREDLYYRLVVVTLEIPPLRDRREDVPLLARLFLQKFAQETGREVDDFDAETLTILEKSPLARKRTLTFQRGRTSCNNQHGSYPASR